MCHVELDHDEVQERPKSQESDFSVRSSPQSLVGVWVCGAAGQRLARDSP